MAQSKSSAASAAAQAEKIQKDFSEDAKQAVDALREATEAQLIKGKEAYEQLRGAAEETGEVLEDSVANITAGLRSINAKVIELTQNNVNTSFEFAQKLVNAKNLSDVGELNNDFVRQQLEAVSSQAKELALLTESMVNSSTKPLQESMLKAFNRITPKV